MVNGNNEKTKIHLELKNFVDKYVKGNNNRYSLIGEKEGYFIFEDILSKANCDFDHPDGYIVYNRCLYIIEHFEFDSSKKTKDGSKLHEFDFELDKQFDSSNKIYIGKYDVSVSLENYKLSFIKNLEKHYKQIDNYKKNLKNKIGWNECKIIFVIEDKSILFGAAIHEENMISLYPFMLKNLVSEMKKRTEIDYFVFGKDLTNIDIRKSILKRKSEVYLYSVKSTAECVGYLGDNDVVMLNDPRYINNISLKIKR